MVKREELLWTIMQTRPHYSFPSDGNVGANGDRGFASQACRFKQARLQCCDSFRPGGASFVAPV
jgi:hypothetical protein